VETWKGPRLREKLSNKLLYVTCEQQCFRITKEVWEEVTELKSSQEEADTRLLLHALHAAESGINSIVISAEDTDVLVLCLAVSKTIPRSMYMKCGTKNRTRYLDIQKLSHALGGAVCEALIGMHAFTGCDTVSAFAGRGKLATFKRLKSHKTYQEAFAELGQSWEVSGELFRKLQKITCNLYPNNCHSQQASLPAVLCQT